MTEDRNRLKAERLELIKYMQDERNWWGLHEDGPYKGTSRRLDDEEILANFNRRSI